MKHQIPSQAQPTPATAAVICPRTFELRAAHEDIAESLGMPLGHLLNGVCPACDWAPPTAGTGCPPLRGTAH